MENRSMFVGLDVHKETNQVRERARFLSILPIALVHDGAIRPCLRAVSRSTDSWTDEKNLKTRITYHEEIASGCCGHRGLFAACPGWVHDYRYSQAAAPLSSVLPVSTGQSRHAPSVKAMFSIEPRAFRSR